LSKAILAWSRASRQVKSSQVKSRFKMAVAFPPPLVPIAGASDREGRSRRNRHHWKAPSRGIIPIFLILIIAARRTGASTSCLFRKSTVRQCSTAPGRRRERSGACARAAPMGQGVGRVWRPPAGATATRVVEGVSAVRATHPVLYLTHARAFATYRCGVDGGARGSRAAGAAEREGHAKEQRSAEAVGDSAATTGRGRCERESS
jgi:hypothetical protein